MCGYKYLGEQMQVSESIRPTVTFNEESVRMYLHRRLAVKHQNEANTIFFYELGICQGSARIDLAVVNGQLHGYEIKSDRDNLRRLGTQAVIYSKVFDRVTLVCGDRHVSHALDIVPSWWEVWRIVPTTKDPEFRTVRVGRNNPNREIRALAQLLWLEEARSLLAQRHSLRGLRGKPRGDLWDKVCELFRIEEVAEAVRSHLMATAAKRGRPVRQL